MRHLMRFVIDGGLLPSSGQNQRRLGIVLVIAGSVCLAGIGAVVKSLRPPVDLVMIAGARGLGGSLVLMALSQLVGSKLSTSSRLSGCRISLRAASCLVPFLTLLGSVAFLM